MKFRLLLSTLFAFLCVALLSSEELVGATLQIQVYDYAIIGPASLGKIVSELEDILRYTGISVQVRVCRGSIAVVCGDPEGPVIRILPGNAKTMRNLRRPPLGRSFATQTGGTYATIFLGAVCRIRPPPRTPRGWLCWRTPRPMKPGTCFWAIRLTARAD